MGKQAKRLQVQIRVLSDHGEWFVPAYQPAAVLAAPAREPWAYDPNRAPLGVVMPYHCGQPAWLRPSGWYCRGCSELLTDETAELRDI